MNYRGYPVLEREPSRDDRTDALQTGRVILDNQTGRRVVRSGWNHGRFVRQLQFMLHGRQDIREFREWLDSRKGRALPFWFPSWQEDLSLTADVPAGGSQVTVENAGFRRGNLAFIRPDGSMQLRYAKVQSENEATQTLTLDSPLDSFSRHWMVSNLALGRLDTDEPEIRWHTPAIAETSIPVAEINFYASIAGLHTACGLVTWRGSDLHEVHIYAAYHDKPIEDGWPTGGEPAIIPGTQESYEFIPPLSGRKLFAQIEGVDATGEVGSVWRVEVDSDG
jgi:hypothetical protein